MSAAGATGQPGLEPRDRVLVRLFVACVLGRFDDVRDLRRAAAPGEPDRRWREVVLQVHVFAGVPRQVESYAALGECGGLGALEPGEQGTAADAHARGVALFERIYGRNAPDVRAMLAGHHPDFDAWVLDHAYARVLARDGLSAAFRETLACAALAALGQERQLASHARGAIRCGARVADVHAALDAIADFVPPERLSEAHRVVERFALP